MKGGPAVIDYSTAPINSALIEARQLAGMKVGELAAAAGFGSSFITYYERLAACPNLTMKTMYRYAKALGLEFRIDDRGLHISDASGGEFLANFTDFDGDGE